MRHFWRIWKHSVVECPFFKGDQLQETSFAATTVSGFRWKPYCSIFDLNCITSKKPAKMLERLVALKIRCVRASSELFISRTLYIELSTKNNNNNYFVFYCRQTTKKNRECVLCLWTFTNILFSLLIHSVGILCPSCFPFLALLIQREY